MHDGNIGALGMSLMWTTKYVLDHGSIFGRQCGFEVNALLQTFECPMITACTTRIDGATYNGCVPSLATSMLMCERNGVGGGD